MIHTDIDILSIADDSASLVDLVGDFGSSVTKISPWKPLSIMVRKYELPRFRLIPL